MVSAFISVLGALFLLFLCLVLLCCIRNFDIIYHYNPLGDFFLKKMRNSKRVDPNRRGGRKELGKEGVEIAVKIYCMKQINVQ